MKATILKTAMLATLTASFIFVGCDNATSTGKDAINGHSGVNNSGNGANVQGNPPGTEYPGSAGDSMHTIQDTIHVRP